MVDEPRRHRTISADWVLKRIQEGKTVRLKNAIIVGDIDLNKLDLPTEHNIDQTKYQIDRQKLGTEIKIVSSLIKITNSEFDAVTRFNNCLFQERINFENTRFNGGSNFSGAKFSSDTNFSGATLDPFFIGAAFCGLAFFSKATFTGLSHFDGATFYMDAYFDESKFNMHANFDRAIFYGHTYFDKAKFNGTIRFNKATFNWWTFFRETTFGENTIFRSDAIFSGATFGKKTTFYRATFNGVAFFEEATFENTEFSGATFVIAFFSKAKFSKKTSFIGTKFEGDFLTFEGATFVFANSQEEACRRAKNVLAKAGNRDEEEYHFYREMEAKRIQKGIRGNSGLGLSYVVAKTETWSFWRFFFYDVIEYFFVQEMFGYGVHPKRLMISWGAIVLAFGFFYWYGDGIIGTTGWLDYIKVSFATAIAPGYIAAIINPGSAGYRLVPAYQIVAMIETIVGTFLWAGFIATFAKKYMR